MDLFKILKKDDIYFSCPLFPFHISINSIISLISYHIIIIIKHKQIIVEQLTINFTNKMLVFLFYITLMLIYIFIIKSSIKLGTIEKLITLNSLIIVMGCCLEMELIEMKLIKIKTKECCKVLSPSKV